MLVHHRLRTRQALLAIVAAGLALMGGLYLLLRPQPLMVRGVLLNVEATSIIHAGRITLRDQQGRTWLFRVSPQVASNPQEPQSASHLRQHMLAAEAMRVYYQPTSEGPLAVRIIDDDLSTK